MKPPVTIEIPKLLSKEPYKKVTISEDGITIDMAPNGIPVIIPVDDLVAFRYGFKWISGRAFTIGRHFMIEFKTTHQKNIIIKFSSYYGLRKKAYGKNWADLVNSVWSHHFLKRYTEYYNRFKEGQSFELCGMIFNEDSIAWDKTSLNIRDVGISNYRHYFMVYNKLNKTQQKGYTFMQDWNALVLKYLLKTITEEHLIDTPDTTSDTHP
ncbi:hypothetical protein [Mucilaginibacter celer]|uniref:Uncharacterized protein n=1 Tax=Mucilaginibacter celer TaxID=2305508 RepID=A0A494VRN1_9SPHI|nr:hypothetical protein [Mucilaginibacter celer]AYL96040.1 hypothetical protein HYN43_012410 [Mucilaginibacter celer]